ncbi:MAG: prolipoprotein diacylglyceryl transferase [Acidobacteria bacterium]|nr:MAG: prolipoprotein diacylglyceryl transferase [Acidobacteriota bacterium]
MHPVLIDFGTVRLFGQEFPLVIGSYGVMMAISLLLGLWLVNRWGKQVYPEAPWTDIVMGTFIAGFIGAKLANAVVFWRELATGQMSLIGVLRGGGVWLGGALLGTAYCIAMLRRHRMEIGASSDVFFTVVPLAHGLGRIGCLLGGCCYGSACDLPWAITYTDPLAAKYNGTPLNVPLHPTPVYEFLLEMANFAVCYALWRRRPRGGTVAGTWVLLYGVERFFLEFLRSDPRGQYGPLTTSQWISLAMVAAGTALLLKVQRAAAGAPAGASAPAARRRPR